MATSNEAIKAQLDALDRRLAGEHAENREALREARQQLATIDEKVDKVMHVGVRHDEQIKTLQRGGGGALSFIITLLGALIADRLRRMGG